MIDSKELTEFLNRNADFIFDIHSKMLKEFKKELLEEEQNPRILSINGKHRRSCVWSQNNCTEGPDTCECIFFQFRWNRIQEIISMYYKVFANMNTLMCK